ncbi:MAG TPA: TonB-dependent receptor, partial [Rhodanobacteraceae bacterium]
SGPTGGGYTVKSEYLEVNVPLLKDLPFAKELSLDVAGRHSKYSSFGSTTNMKYTLTWRPIQDLLVGGTFSHGFRAPQIADLFGGIGGTFDYYADPCSVANEAGSNPAVAQRCDTGFGGQNRTPVGYVQLGQGGSVCSSGECQTGTQFMSGPNPHLTPERAINRSAQIVYSPSWIPQQYGKFDFDVDYFNIRIINAITGDSVDSILHDCYVLGVVSRCSQALFTRDPNTGVVNSAAYIERNAGWLWTKGWDFGVHYTAPQTAAGLFQLTWNTTYYSNQESKADNEPTTPVSMNNGWGSNFRYRSTATLDWSKGPFGASWTTRFYSSMKEACSYNNTPAGGPECNMPNYVQDSVIFNANRVGDSVFHDVSFRYMTPWNATVSVGVNNVFNHWAGAMYSDPNNQYPYYGGFDIGRYYFLRYNQKF